MKITSPRPSSNSSCWEHEVCVLNQNANFSLNQLTTLVKISKVKKQQAMLVDYPPLCFPYILSCALVGSNWRLKNHVCILIVEKVTCSSVSPSLLDICFSSQSSPVNLLLMDHQTVPEEHPSWREGQERLGRERKKRWAEIKAEKEKSENKAEKI